MVAYRVVRFRFGVNVVRRIVIGRVRSTEGSELVPVVAAGEYTA